MKRLVSILAIATVVCVCSASAEAGWMRENAIRNGLGVGMVVDCGPACKDMTGNFNLRLRALDYTPLELEGGWLIGKGAYLKLNSYKFYLKNWFTLHLIDFGLIKWQSGAVPFNNPNEARRYDVMVGGGAEMRIMRNLTFAVDVGWYLPNPMDVISRAKDNVNKAFDAPASNNSPTSPSDTENQVKNAIEHIPNVYKYALKDVHLSGGLRWYF